MTETNQNLVPEPESQGPDVHPSPQGGPDLSVLERSISPENTRRWLKARLRRADRLWPMDERSMEPPEQLFIDLWRMANPGSKIRHSVAHACRELLLEAKQADGEEWVQHLLFLVGSVVPTECQPPLMDAVLSELPASKGMRQLWLQAAARYPPETDELRKRWIALLQRANGAVAYSALAHDLRRGAIYLPDYYRQLGAESAQLRRALLRQTLDRLRRKHGAADTISALRFWSALSWQGQDISELKKTIDDELSKLKLPRAFEPADAPPAHARTPLMRTNKLEGIAGVKSLSNPVRLAA